MSSMKSIYTAMALAAMMGGSDFGYGPDKMGGPGAGDDIKRGEQFNRTCPVCWAAFQTTSRYQKFCSDKCRDEYGRSFRNCHKKGRK